jgi:anti-sigma B factor antagonist
MKMEVLGDTLRISAIKELGATNARAFRREVDEALGQDQRNLELDLSETTFVDSCGLGTLVALQKTLLRRQGVVRLLNPPPPVEQILDLTRTNRIFEVLKQ